MTQKTSNIGRRFRLISRTTEFVVENEFLAAGFIPAVRGVTLDGKFQTCPRIADITWLS